MDVQISTGEKWKRHIEINLTSSEFDPHVQKNLRTFQKQARLDGFRRGKVPMGMVQRLFGDEAKRKAIEDIIPDLLTEVSKQHRLNTVGPAQVDEIKFDEQAGLKLRATVEVQPEVELKNYSGFLLDKVVYDITDDDISEALERLREQNSWLESVETGAQPGHIVTADVQVVDALGVPLIGRHHKDQRFRVAQAGESTDDFTPQLVGVKPEESRRVKSVSEDAEGKPHEHFYRIDVKEVSEVKLPELDDELARTVGNFETLDELRQAIANDIRAQAEQRSRDDLHDALVEEILKNNPIELPESMLEAYTNAYFENLKSTFKDVKGIKDEDLREEAHKRTIRFLKWRYIREHIAEIEHLIVSEEEMRNYLTALASARNEEPQRLLNQTMNDEKKREDLRDRLENEKVLAFLETKMRIEPRKVPYKDRNKSKIITA